MATRTPTDFSGSAPDFRPRKEILAADADDLFDDQQFVLEKNEMVIGDQFPVLIDNSSATWTTLRRYFTRAPDMCGTAATIDAEFSLLVWSDDATDFDIAIYHNGRAARHTYNVTANHTSHIWRAWTAITLYGDGTENELLIQINNVNSPSTPVIYLAGVALFTDM